MLLVLFFIISMFHHKYAQGKMACGVRDGIVLFSFSGQIKHIRDVLEVITFVMVSSASFLRDDEDSMQAYTTEAY